MATVTGILRDAQQNAIPNAGVTVRYTRALVGFNGGAVAQNDRLFTTDGSGLLTMTDLIPGHYDVFVSMPVNANTTEAVIRRGTGTVPTGEATLSWEAFLSEPIGQVTSSIAQQAAQAAADAQTAAATAVAAAAGVEFPVSYAPQTLDAGQQEQARENISTRHAITPEQFGAQSGYFVDPETATVAAAIRTAGHTIREPYLRFLDHTVRRFIRGFAWPDVSFTVLPTGFAAFTTTLTLPDVKRHAFDYINGIYEDQGPWLLGAGEVVTASMQAADGDIDVSANTTAMRNWLEALEGGGPLGVMGPRTYPVNDFLQARDRVTIEGVKGSSRIVMQTAERGVPVFVAGLPDELSQDVNISGVIFDANYYNRPVGDGGWQEIASSLRGTALALSFGNRLTATDCQGWDSEKHCLDLIGADDARSGTSGTIPERAQISRGLRAIRFIAEGFGDDGITTHNLDDFLVEDCDALFARLTWSVGNSVAFEFDDASRNGRLLNCRAKFCYFGAQIKTHNDAEGAYNCSIDGLDIWKCDNGVRTSRSQLTGILPTTRLAFIENVTFRHPLYWSDNRVGGRLSPPGRALDMLSGYEAGTVRNFRVIQEGAASNFFNSEDWQLGPVEERAANTTSSGIFCVRGGGGSSFSGLFVDGFKDSIAAFRLTSTSTGQFTINGIETVNGPLRAIFQSDTGDNHLIVNDYALHRTLDGGSPTAGTWGIRAFRTSVGVGRITGFERQTSRDAQPDSGLSGNRVRLLTSANDLNTIGDEDVAFTQSFSWTNTSTPANAPQTAFATMVHQQRSSASRSQLVMQSAGTQRMWQRGYTNDQWTDWFEIMHTGLIRTDISATPSFVGQTAVVDDEAYIAVGVNSSADWKQIT